MKQKKGFFIKLLASFVLLFSAFGVAFSGVNPWKSDVTASAETIEYQDLLGVEDRTSWASGGHADIVTFGLMDFSITEGNKYFRSSVNGCWYNGNDAVITANNGLDIMEYVYIDGLCARDLLIANATEQNATADTAYWLSNPAAWPIAFETGGDCWIRIDKTKFDGDFTFTIKAGFELNRNDGARIHVSDDIIYNYVGGALSKVNKNTVTFNNENGTAYTTKRVINGQSIGELPEVPEKDGYVGFWTIDGVAVTENTVISANKTATPVYALEYQDLLGLEDRAWGAHEGEYYFGGVTLDPFGYFNSADSVCGAWYVGNTTPITANNGVDIMEYIHVNGTSARALITANANGDRLGNSCGCWLSNPAAWPVYVETSNGSGIIIRLAKAYFGDSVTLTFKKGFSLIRNDGEVIYVSGDITYTYEGGAFTSRTVEKEYKLTFDGVETRRIAAGATIGELPAVPAKDGCEGVWKIDGVEITAETAYNYGENKTATVAYKANYNNLLGLEDRTSWGAHEGEYYFGGVTLEPFGYFNSADSVCGAWYVGNSNIIAANNNVDIMEYIYVNGTSARELITANANGDRLSNSCGCWLSNPAASPVFVETTNGSGIMIRLLKSVFGDSFTLTFKAGFSLIRNDGVVIYLTSDVNYSYSNGTLSKVMGFTLTFEGVETRTVEVGAPIGTLPAIPPKAGCVALYWTIDGVKIDENTIISANKTATPVYALEYKDLLGLEDRAWGAKEDEYYFGGVTLDPFGYFNTADSVSGCWNVTWDNNYAPAYIENNNGVDIMEYIYVNGEQARAACVQNGIDNTYAGVNGGWIGNGGVCAPVCVETTNGSGILIRILKAYAGDSFTFTFKAGFSLLRNDGEVIYLSEDVTYIYSGTLQKAQEYTLTFEGADETRGVFANTEIGELPAVPAHAQDSVAVGVWTIDGVEITAETLYTYGANKTAVATYSRDITKDFALENRTSWGAHTGEFYLGVLDMNEANKVENGDSVTYYLNTDLKLPQDVSTCWYHGNDTIIAANNGIDIMQYIYINDKSARDWITENVNGANLKNDCGCWLSNPAASPVFVETSNGAGIMIRVLKAALDGEYFQITIKRGFSILNNAGVRVYLTKDITYKCLGDNFTQGKLTDEDLDQFNGEQVTLINGGETYFSKKTCRVTLPDIAPIAGNENTPAKILVGWSTAANSLAEVYPVGYKLVVTAEVTLYAVWFGFDMQDGAAVRLAADSAGIRFLTDINAGAYNNGLSQGFILEAGTILTPTDYLQYVDAFVHASFAQGQYSEVKALKWSDQEGDVWTYTAAFTNIKVPQYNRSFSARGYLKVNFATGVGYVYTPYSEELNARSIYEVATGAYNDPEEDYTNNAVILDYVNSVVDITINADFDAYKTEGAVGNYTVDLVGYDVFEGINEFIFDVNVNVDEFIVSVNGTRLVNGSAGGKLIEINGLFWAVDDYTIDGTELYLALIPAEELAKESEDMLYFESSNAEMDFFLNDYFKRHSAVVEDGKTLQVNSAIAGAGAEEFFNHEWLSMSYYWYNSFDSYTDVNGHFVNRIDGMRDFLSSVPVDDYGYVWSSNDRVRDPYSDVTVGEQKMGWPFPNNKTVGTAHWEFNGSSEGSWSSNVSASVSGGLYNANLNGQSSNITFTSNSFNSVTSKKIYTKYAPLLEFEVRIDDATNVEDIYVWYTTSSSTSFSADKKVSVNEKAFIKYAYSGAYNHVLYLPMYAESAWGESTSTYVKQIKIEIVLKSGKTISGNVGLNYVRPTLDTRMSNNNSILISSLRTDYDNTGDLEYLAANITRARKAMNFLMQMYDATRGLKKESYLVGHGGAKEGLNWLGNTTANSIASSMSQGYWDIMYMPEYDFQSNMYFYKAARDLAYLEDVLAENSILVDKALAAVKTADRNGNHAVSAYNSTNLKTIANTVLNNLRQTTEDTNHTGFWNAEAGRFLAGYASGEGRWYDYGYVAWNLEAIYYGIATEEQATAIMNWLSNESSLYDYVFAPRSNTVEGTDMLNGEYAAMKGDWSFGDNCQYGGAIMYTSFYDLMARIDTNGKDDAFARLKAIQQWYQEVYDYYVANGSNPYDFYRYYYDNKGIQCQGMGEAGAVGLDREFLESFLPVSAVAYGFFGIEANGTTLEIAPELPEELDYWKMENLAFNFVKYDLKIFDGAIQISNVRGDTSGLSLQIALDWTEGQSIYVNGEAVEYTVENGKAYVTFDFGASIVEVR